jgi:hypothetical protein
MAQPSKQVWSSMIQQAYKPICRMNHSKAETWKGGFTKLEMFKHFPLKKRKRTKP